MKLITWLNRPYPLIEDPRYKLVITLSFGLFVSLFLVIYRPFGAGGDIEGHKFFYLMGFGMPVSAGVAASYFVLPRFLPSFFNAEQWQVKKEILFVASCFLIISLLNYSYHKVVGASFAPQRSWLEFFGLSLSIGIFPLMVWVFLVELKFHMRKPFIAHPIAPQWEQDADEKGQDIMIIPETAKAPPLKLRVEDFLFAKSDNNYTTFFFLENKKLEKRLLRITLKKVESQVAEHSEIIRCHRTYLVNKSKIRCTKGNARSLTIQLEGYEGAIPVSRKFPGEMLLS